MNYEDILKEFKGKRILVVGDVMLDAYILGKVTRVSPEAPVPVVALDKKENLMFQNIGDDDIFGEAMLFDEPPKEERTREAIEGEALLENTVRDPSSSSGPTGPPSPLTPTDVSPRQPSKEENQEDEIPYPYPNPDLRKGKHHGSTRPP